MSPRNKVSKGLGTAAFHIGITPAKVVMWTFPNHGPGSTAYAVLLSMVSFAITSPITLPIWITAILMEKKS